MEPVSDKIDIEQYTAMKRLVSSQIGAIFTGRVPFMDVVITINQIRDVLRGTYAN